MNLHKHYREYDSLHSNHGVHARLAYEIVGDCSNNGRHWYQALDRSILQEVLACRHRQARLSTKNGVRRERYWQRWWIWLLIAFITCKSNLVLLLEGLCSSNPWRFEFSSFLSFCRKRTDDLRIKSPAFWPTELVLHHLGLMMLFCYFVRNSLVALLKALCAQR